MSAIVELIEQGRNQPQFGGMGDVHIHYNPYTTMWTCKFNWSNNEPISASYFDFVTAIELAVLAIQQKSR